MATFNLPDTPSSIAITDWVVALRAAEVEGRLDIFSAPLPPLVAAATVDDFKAANWDFDTADNLDAFESLEGRTWMAFSPDRRHLAVMYDPQRGPTRLWVDGRSIDPPLVDGNPVSFTLSTRWLLGHHFLSEVGLPYEHPLALQARVQGDNPVTVAGYLLYDAERQRTELVLPRNDQAWTQPVAHAQGDRIVVYATPADAKAGRAGWASDSLTG